jgi:hypothetical protein
MNYAYSQRIGKVSKLKVVRSDMLSRVHSELWYELYSITN